MIILPTTDNELRVFLERLGDAVLDYDRLRGFLFAVACSPELVKASEWFELIWLDDDPQFDDEDEAKRFFQLLREAMADIERGIVQGRCLPFFPPESEQEKNRLGLWCEGFLIAHQYLEELWELALMDLDAEPLDDAITAVLNLATVFTEAVYQGQLHFDEVFDDAELENSETDKDKFQEAYQWFDEVLGVYAGIRSEWQELQAFSDVDQLFLALEPVARDEPCPCGSGLPFEKCCLH
ncbi:MAG: yecA family protein [Pseudohongiellaceae bacterium]|jgi:yecA family protein